MTGSPLRVTLLAPVPPPMGGIARWTSQFVAAAPAHDLDVRVVNVSPARADRTENSRFRWERATHAFRILAELQRNLGAFRPDVVHVTTNLRWATLRDAAAVEVAQRQGVPALLNIRGSNQMVAWREALPGPARATLDAAFRRAAAVVVLSTELEAYLRRTVPGARIERIPNMVETARTSSTPVLPPRKYPVRVLFVGWCMPGKGVTELAEAVLALPDVELVCVGSRVGAADDAAARAMNARLDALRKTGRLLELQEMPPERVLQIYTEADIFALPTYQEGLPNVLLEAMAAGLPCVVTPVGAIPDVVGTDRAIVVPPREVAPLRDALALLASDPALRRTLGDRGRAHVAQAHSSDFVLHEYSELYADLCRRWRKHA